MVAPRSDSTLAVIPVFVEGMGRPCVHGVTFEFSVHGAGLASGKPLVVHTPEALAGHLFPRGPAHACRTAYEPICVRKQFLCHRSRAEWIRPPDRAGLDASGWPRSGPRQ